MKHLMIASLLVFVLAGCVSNKAFEIEKARSLEMQRQQGLLMQRLEEMRSEMLQDRNVLIKYGYDTEQLKRQFASVDSLSKQVNRVNDNLSKQAENLLASQTLAEDLRFLINRISTLQEEFADNNRLLIEFRQSNADHQESVNQRLANLEKGVRTPPAKTSPPPEKTIQTPEPEKAPPKQEKPKSEPAKQIDHTAPIRLSTEIPKAATVSEQQAYNDAKAAYDRRQFDRAISMFDEYLRLYPKQPLAVNAHYWIGESHYAMLDYSGAYRIFRTLATNYPSSPKAPDALVKMSLCSWKMGDFTGARQDLMRIKSTYPDYERMSLVNKLLQEVPN